MYEVFDIVENNKTIHFIGIGGIGVSGIAEIMHSMGYRIQGSDQSRSQNIDRLEKLGVRIFIGHDEKNIENAQIVVFSSAIKMDNPEILYAKKHKIPLLSRSEMLSQIIRFKKSIVISGSHGKTTVTSLCAEILEMASMHPTVVNGGLINAYQTNAKLGSGDWAVVESDESDGSFIHLFPTIGIITNIDYEHIDYYGSFSNLKNAFTNFVKNTPFYGGCIVCFDDPNIVEITSQILGRRIISYAINNSKAMYRAINIKQNEKYSNFDIAITNGVEKIIKGFSIPLLGTHNILNVLAATAMAIELRINPEIIKSSFKGFTGVYRRFTHVGSLRGIKFIDDYAHHPTEIKSVLNAAKQASNKGKIAIICQPHRFTRLTNLFDEFTNVLSKADIKIITPVYKVIDKEPNMKDSKDLFKALLKTDNTFFANNKIEIQNIINKLIQDNQLTEGDIVIFAGAGSISKWAHEIFKSIYNENK